VTTHKCKHIIPIKEKRERNGNELCIQSYLGNQVYMCWIDSGRRWEGWACEVQSVYKIGFLRNMSLVKCGKQVGKNKVYKLIISSLLFAKIEQCFPLYCCIDNVHVVNIFCQLTFFFCCKFFFLLLLFVYIGIEIAILDNIMMACTMS